MSTATVPLRTAYLALGGVAALGLAGLIAVFAVPVDRPAAPPPPVAKVATPAPVVIPQAPAMSKTYTVASYIARPARFDHGAFIWNDDNVPAGPMLVLVDVQTQLMHVFQGGREVGVAAVLYGADDSPTPLGVHTVRWKKARHTSSIFKTPMPYTLNLTGDGIAVHGSNVRYGWGTNGCIGIPIEFAQLLFDKMAVGDRVVVVKGKTPQPGQSVPLA